MLARLLFKIVRIQKLKPGNMNCCPLQGQVKPRKNLQNTNLGKSIKKKIWCSGRWDRLNTIRSATVLYQCFQYQVLNEAVVWGDAVSCRRGQGPLVQ